MKDGANHVLTRLATVQYAPGLDPRRAAKPKSVQAKLQEFTHANSFGVLVESGKAAGRAEQLGGDRAGLLHGLIVSDVASRVE